MGNCKAAALRIPPSKSAPITILKNGFYDTTKTVRHFSHKDTCDTASPLWPFRAHLVSFAKMITVGGYPVSPGITVY